MASNCSNKSPNKSCTHSHGQLDVFDGVSRSYKHALITVIIINALMFFVELSSGIIGQSQALLTDALDFLMDTLTYSLSYLVIGKARSIRSRVALFKGYSLIVMGVLILLLTIYRATNGYSPSSSIMSKVSLLALLANASCLFILYKFKDGDANVRSTWLCSRNDAIGNFLVLLAGVAVYLSNSFIPDVLVACFLAGLFLKSAWEIIQQAKRELE